MGSEERDWMADLTSGRLHPDGAPGMQSEEMRKQMGDVEYELFIANQQRAIDINHSTVMAQRDCWAAKATLLSTLAFCAFLLTVTVIVLAAINFG
jgi:hypothetical protein